MMMRDPEGFYDTPWEFSCSPAALITAGRLASISDRGSMDDHESHGPESRFDATAYTRKPNAQPVNASSSSTFQRRNESIEEDPEPVWKFRGPEVDSRNSEEYDVPWDLKHVDIKLKKGGYGRSIDGWRPMSEIYEPVWSVSRAISSTEQKAIPDYDRQSSKSGSRTDSKPNGHFPFTRRDPSVPRNKPSGASNESNGGSPSTSASSSSDLKSKSSGSLSSNEGTLLGTKESIATVPPGLSIPYPVHEFVPDDQATNGARCHTVTKSASTPITPLMETAFCVKANNISNNSGSKSAKELQKINREEARDRRIQQVCGDRNFSTNPDKASRPKPVPAIRRSKLKPVNVTATSSHSHNYSLSPSFSSLKTPVIGGATAGASHLIEIRGTPMVLTTTGAKDTGPKKFSSPPTGLARKNVTVAASSEKIITGNRNNDQVSPDSAAAKKRLEDAQQQQMMPPSCQEEYDVPWEFCSSKKLTRLLEKKGTGADKQNGDGLDRKTLSLNFGCSRLNPEGDHLNPDIPLQTQEWYHGNVSRVEAEQRLSLAAEGSFLVRLCESNKDEFALSLKSAKGFMHMKIQLDADGKWVLGYFSHPFETIPRMIRYYAINKLPIKGAEHMCLLHPVKDQLL